MNRSRNSSPFHWILLTAAAAIIAPGAVLAQDAISVDPQGFVGVGTSAPASQLHVSGNDIDSKVLVVNGGSLGTPITLFDIRHEGGTFFAIDNLLGSNGRWTFSSTGANNFVISSQGNPGSEFSMTPSGNLTILGSLTQQSSREAKQEFAPVDGREVLDRLSRVPISTWTYKNSPEVPHMGPMAEDFFEAFRLNGTRHGIGAVDADGVAFAAIQGLYEVVQEKDATIETLRAENEALSQRLSRIEETVEALSSERR